MSITSTQSIVTYVKNDIKSNNGVWNGIEINITNQEEIITSSSTTVFKWDLNH